VKKSSNRRRNAGKKQRKAAAPTSAATETSDAVADTSVPPVIEGRADEVKKKPSTSPFAFAQQVRSEGEKVSWTSRNETLISTVMVLIMVAIMAVFFFLVDQSLRFAVCNVLPIECVSRAGQ